MAYQITEACTACDRCVDVCPISAIEPGDPIYVINDTCCDFEECLVECPEDAIVQIPDDPAPSTVTQPSEAPPIHSRIPTHERAG